jgi:hypothetical protein
MVLEKAQRGLLHKPAWLTSGISSAGSVFGSRHEHVHAHVSSSRIYVYMHTHASYMECAQAYTLKTWTLLREPASFTVDISSAVRVIRVSEDRATDGESDATADERYCTNSVEGEATVAYVL